MLPLPSGTTLSPMPTICFPRPLRTGDHIGVTAPSSGITPPDEARFQLALEHMRQQGYAPVEGACVRGNLKHVSAPAAERAADFLRFWRDESVAAIMPPWGGELLVEILPLLDFEELGRGSPKWVVGYSDISTLLLPITLKSGIATLHGATLLDLKATQTDPLTNGVLEILRLAPGATHSQQSSERWQKDWPDMRAHPEMPFHFTEPTRWKGLRPRDEAGATMKGRLIGGCIDTVARLAGTPYGGVPEFTRAHRGAGVILYFENCELRPCELARTLWNLRLAGWFEGLSGILIGRSTGADASHAEDLLYTDALASVLAPLPMPIVIDADIGHAPPQLALVNGAVAELDFAGGRGRLTQRLI